MDPSIRYYQLIADIYKLAHREIEGLEYESVELYSDTGYPLAVSPSKYLQRIQEWNLEHNTMLYVYPKRISVREISSKELCRGNYSVNVGIESTDITLTVLLYSTRIFCCELKSMLSLQLHIPTEVLELHILYVDTRIKEVPNDTLEMETYQLVKERVLVSVRVLDDWADESYLGAFSTKLYKSCFPQNNVIDWNYFNCLLLYLSKEQLRESRGDLLAKLGLLRRISCSPPLVYALHRLLTGATLCLPHRVAINEGILTTLSFLMPDREPGIHNFPLMWLYLEHNALREHSSTERYETHYISKHSRERPRDPETRRFLQAFPPTEDSIVTWSDCPSAHEPFSYKRLSEKYFSQNQINQRFPLEHPIELYEQYLTSGTDYGLLAPIPGLSSYCVFLGASKGRYGYFEFFYPNEGRSLSCNPHDIVTSYPLQIEDSHTYPKLIIVLDISKDMDFGCGEYTAGRDSKEPNLTLTSLDMAISTIELLIDHLIGIGTIYLLGIVLISNDHHHHQKFRNGVCVLQDPTLEYLKALRILNEFVHKYSPLQDNITRLPQGIIVNALLQLIDNLQPNSTAHKLQVFLLTNHLSDMKYYGTKIHTIPQRFLRHKLSLNTLILSDKKCERVSDFSKITKGKNFDQTVIAGNKFKFLKEKLPSHYLIECLSFFEDTLDPLVLRNTLESYDRIINALKKEVTNSDSMLEKVQRDKVKFMNLSANKKLPNLIQILRQISNYSKNPNPYCQLFSIRDDIQHWICIIQGPDNTPYRNSVLFLQIRFGICYPQKPPKFHFLSSYFHPNIRLTGELCHPIIFEDYHAGVSLRHMLDSIYDLFCSPVPSHAVRYKVMEIFSFHKEVYVRCVETFLNVYRFKRSVSECLQDFCVKNSHKTTHPELYLCPLTHELFDQPVMTLEGYTYERHAILQHLRHRKTDPISKTKLTEGDLIPNNAVISGVYKYRKKWCDLNYWWEK